jgi:hemerythrin
MKWSQSLETGHKGVDDEHKELFILVDKMLDACTKGEYTSDKRLNEVEAALGFLESYAIKHFANEERLMEQSKYPDKANHKTQHAGFLPVFAGLKKRALTENSLTVALEINKALVDWLIQHIMGSDRKFADYYKASQAK